MITGPPTTLRLLRQARVDEKQSGPKLSRQMQIEIGHDDRATTEFAQQVKKSHRVSPVGTSDAQNRQSGEVLGNPTRENPRRDNEGNGLLQPEECAMQLHHLQKKVV